MANDYSFDAVSDVDLNLISEVVQVAMKEISNRFDLKSAGATIVLDAKPNELAQEKPGDCSQFEGHAGWLTDSREFIANGTVTFMGKQQTFKIEYPKGYDPD